MGRKGRGEQRQQTQAEAALSALNLHTFTWGAQQRGTGLGRLPRESNWVGQGGGGNKEATAMERKNTRQTERLHRQSVRRMHRAQSPGEVGRGWGPPSRLLPSYSKKMPSSQRLLRAPGGGIAAGVQAGVRVRGSLQISISPVPSLWESRAEKSRWVLVSRFVLSHISYV